MTEWTVAEHRRFVLAQQEHHLQYFRIAAAVQTRTPEEVRAYAQQRNRDRYRISYAMQVEGRGLPGGARRAQTQ